MPACPSSPITLLAERIGPTPDGVVGAGEDEVGTAAPADLLAALGRVPDPRARRGVRHRLVTVLAVAVCAVLAGARSYVAVAEWAHDLPIGVRVRLGLSLRRRPPSESTIRRVLQKLDPEALDRIVSAWLADRAAAARSAPPSPPSSRLVVSPAPSAPRAIAVDGKTARGAHRPDGSAVHLLAALDQASGVVLGQSVVDAKTNEITAFAPLLARVDITGAVITCDALHTQDGHANYLHQRGAHYVFVVKRNRPKLHAQLAELPWRDIPAVDLSRDTGHGRTESRTIKLAAITGGSSGGILFPHARLAIQIVRRRRITATGHAHRETVYAVTDLNCHQIRADHLAQIIRGHWHVENRLHWIRDVVFAEDLSQIRTGHGPANMATLRNLALSRHRLAGATNIAAACRHVSRHPNRALPLLT